MKKNHVKRRFMARRWYGAAMLFCSIAMICANDTTKKHARKNSDIEHTISRGLTKLHEQGTLGNEFITFNYFIDEIEDYWQESIHLPHETTTFRELFGKINASKGDEEFHEISCAAVSILRKFAEEYRAVKGNRKRMLYRSKIFPTLHTTVLDQDAAIYQTLRLLKVEDKTGEIADTMKQYWSTPHQKCRSTFKEFCESVLMAKTSEKFGLEGQALQWRLMQYQKESNSINMKDEDDYCIVDMNDNMNDLSR